jgi:hypothetical protein
VNPPIVIDLCGDFLCMSEATHECHVAHGRGHVIKLCEVHAKKLEERAAAEGVADRLHFRRRGS